MTITIKDKCNIKNQLMKKLVSQLCSDGLQSERKNYQQPLIKSIDLEMTAAVCDVSVDIPNPDIPGDGDLAKDDDGMYHKYQVWED